MIPGFILAALCAGILLYIRFAPVDPEKFHVGIPETSDQDMSNGAIRVLTGQSPDALANVDSAARALPRTELLAGSVEQGRITYVTRSLIYGYPDITTVEQTGDTVKIRARRKFKLGDFKANRKRAERLLAALS